MAQKPKESDLPKLSPKARRQKFGKWIDMNMYHKSKGRTALLPTGICLKDCKNRDLKCEECYRFSELIANEKTEENKETKNTVDKET